MDGLHCRDSPCLQSITSWRPTTGSSARMLVTLVHPPWDTEGFTSWSRTLELLFNTRPCRRASISRRCRLPWDPHALLLQQRRTGLNALEFNNYLHLQLSASTTLVAWVGL